MVSVAALALLAAACGEDADNGEATAEEDAIPVTWIEAAEEEVREVRNTVGSIEAKSRPLLAAEVGGVIDTIHVDEGAQVDRGELLAEIDREDYIDDRDAAAGDVARLTAMVGVQERNVARNRELYEDDHISEDELDNAEAELEAREEELASALAQLRRAERDLERTRIRAVVSGAVDERHISAGDYVNAGDAVFQLINLDRLKVRLPVSESLAPRVDSGTELILSSRSGLRPDLKTTVSDLRPGIRDATRSLQLIAEVDNPGGWRPGASAEAEVVLDVRDGIVVPNQSVVRRPAGEVAYVLSEDEGRVEERTVEVGTRFGDRAEIRDGLEPGERLVLDGAGFLTDGAAVDAAPHEGDDTDTE
ncbi:efflux transporter, RND family, MFP subunit [Halorhodospira halophila SL1]|uniref:Efflux transporter, RND family, MFP subunit n=2 Tax=Halorhodospira halophila TaxID=1053 RepID=A1WYJ0_HALHL|nr:efflux RND transporter periplasmic adaptor subunit [Halorhodospira halophila]ABM62752.1 efflux transporter, RND family, MFP subunit [Halorhodospira halophila SL1]